MSITLAAGDTIAGVAGSATAITYTITGDEIAAGVDAFKVLAQGQLPSAIATLYTVPGSTAAIVKTIHLVNTTGGTVTAELAVKGTAAANQILPPISSLAGGFATYGDDGWNVYNSQGQKLGVGATGATGATGPAGPTGPAGANGLSTSGTPALTLGTTNAAGVATTAIATDATIAAFDATAPATQAFGDAAATGAAAVAARRDHKHGMPADPTGKALGLTGATAATRYVGATASGAPATGTFAVGDFVIDQTGVVWVCTVAGTPGTWVAGSSGLSDHGVFTYLDATVAAAPATPAAGKLRMYAKTGKALAVKDDAGVETVLGAGGGGVAGVAPIQDLASGAGVSTNARTGTMAAAPTNGNLLIMCIDRDGAGAINNITQTGVTWTQLATSGNATAPVVEIWKGVVGASASASFTINCATSVYTGFHVSEWPSSIAGTLDTSASVSGHAGGYVQAPYTPYLTPGQANALVIAAASTTSNPTKYSRAEGMQSFTDMLLTGSTVAVGFCFPGKTPVRLVALDQNGSTFSGVIVSVT